MENLYEQYGKLSIQAEIVNGQLMEVKRKIAEELNKQPAIINKEEEDVKLAKDAK
jgi:hypothetical protein